MWFSPGTPASSTTKTGRHDIAESGVKHQKSNQINHVLGFYTYFIFNMLYVQFLNRLYDITYLVWGSLHLITCSKIENIPYNIIFTTKLNDSSILITIISWDYLNLSLANEYVGISQYQPTLSGITNVVPGRSANQIAVFTSN